MSYMPTTNFRLKLRSSAALIMAATLLGGCSGGIGDMFGGNSAGLATTASIPEAAKVDPACATLVSQIDGLKNEGVADKVANAAAKKYKMSPADLSKADQLNKANGEFQAKCSVGPKPSQTAAVSAPAVPPVAQMAAKAAAAKATASASTVASSAVSDTATSAATTAAKAAVAKAQ
jgi:hypothetical protein